MCTVFVEVYQAWLGLFLLLVVQYMVGHALYCGVLLSVVQFVSDMTMLLCGSHCQLCGLCLALIVPCV